MHRVNGCVRYDQLLRQKVAKGYRPGGDGANYRHIAARETGILPQLLNAIEADDMNRLLHDDDFWMEEKIDGKRLLVWKNKGTVTGINRRGLECGIPDLLRQEILTVSGDFILDGEAVGDVLHVFDLLELDGKDLRGLRLMDRRRYFTALLETRSFSHIEVVGIHFGIQKQEQFRRLRKERAEGVVFKRCDSPYVPLRPSRGGDHLKFKFVKTASFVVTGHNTKRSVALALKDGDQLLPTGNVTIPPNHGYGFDQLQEMLIFVVLLAVELDVERVRLQVL